MAKKEEVQLPENPVKKSKSAADQIETAFKARRGSIWIRTQEELRVRRQVEEIAARNNFHVLLWSVTEGFHLPYIEGENNQKKSERTQILQRVLSTNVRGNDAPSDDENPRVLSEAIPKAAFGKNDIRVVTIFLDPSAYLDDPVSRRTYRDAMVKIQSLEVTDYKVLVILDSHTAPDDIPGIYRLDYPLPTREECSDAIDECLPPLSDEKTDQLLQNGHKEQIIDAALGLNIMELEDAIATSIVITGTIDPEHIAASKREVVARDGVLEWHDIDAGGFSIVGGLEHLKSWLVSRRRGFTVKAREYGLPAPKGVLTVGVPGCGKSLTAKAAASAWKMPLIRLDAGRLFGGLVGQSEEKTRSALSLAETVAPCILWIDEIEKGFAGGAGAARSDAGTSARVLGTFLTWMQERKPGVFVFATCNDIASLPPEFTRAGRWDEMFFVGLPNRSERVAIAKVMANRYKPARGLEDKALEDIANASEGFSGAEIEAAFVNAIYDAYEAMEDKKTDSPSLESLVVAHIGGIVPLSKSQKEKVDALVQWSQGRARNASLPEIRKGSGRRPAGRIASILQGTPEGKE